MTQPRLLVRLVAFGTPAPQGSKDAFPIYRGRGEAREFTGRVAVTEVLGKRIKTWRDAVGAAAQAAMQTATWADDYPLLGPLHVAMVFTMRRPITVPPERRGTPACAPDLSKLARSTEDALTDAGLWKSDAQVVEYRRLAKVYPGTDPEALNVPGALIEVWT